MTKVGSDVEDATVVEFLFAKQNIILLQPMSQIFFHNYTTFTKKTCPLSNTLQTGIDISPLQDTLYF